MRKVLSGKVLTHHTYVAPLSFYAYEKGSPDENYWSNARLGGGIKKTYFEEMDRFQQELQSLVLTDKEKLKSLSINDFLKENNFSKGFAEKLLLPIMTTFSGCNAPSLDYSLLYVAISFNMNLLSFFSPCHWRKLRGGINQYLIQLQAELDDSIRLNSPVVRVIRHKNHSEVILKDGKSFKTKQVIFACQAQIALKLIIMTPEI